jgi:uncharacterized OsmC-like protein
MTPCPYRSNYSRSSRGASLILRATEGAIKNRLVYHQMMIVPLWRNGSFFQRLPKRESVHSHRIHSIGHHDSHMKWYQLKGMGEKSSVTVYTDTGHEIRTDLPKTMGGTNNAPQPVEYLLSAWMGCTHATAIFVARNLKPRRLNISRIDFDIRAYRDERGAISGSLPIEKDSPLPDVPSRLQLIRGTIKIQLKNDEKISEEEMYTLERQTEARCPVANMIHSSGCTFDVKWLCA